MNEQQKQELSKENIPGKTKYANEEALELAVWSIGIFRNDNRIKAYKMKMIADKMEDKYRDSKKFKKRKNQNEYNRRHKIGYVTFQFKDLLMKIKLKEPPPSPPPSQYMK